MWRTVFHLLVIFQLAGGLAAPRQPLAAHDQPAALSHWTFAFQKQPDAAGLQLSAMVVNTLDDELNADGDCSLREAVEAANTNLAVDACPAGEAGAMDSITFAISGTIGLTGTLPAVQPAGPLTIDGGEVITVTGLGSVGVFSALAGADLTLRQLNVLGGFATSGAGLLANGAGLTLESSRFIGNVASAYGGAVFAQGGTLVVTDCQFIDNRVPAAYGQGGALYIQGGTAEVLSSTLLANDADYAGALGASAGSVLTLTQVTLQENTAYVGGALQMVGAQLLVQDSLIQDNQAWANGGGLYNQNSRTRLENTTFTGNQANVNGGGLYNTGSLTVISDTFSFNTSEQDGGGLYNTGSLTITNSTFSHNLSQNNGGGLFSEGGSILLTRAAFSFNQALVNGGGLYSTDAPVSVYTSSFSSNDAWQGRGGGMFSEYATLLIYDSVFYQNDANLDGGGAYHQHGSLFATNSTFASNSTWTGNGGGLSGVFAALDLTHATFSANLAQSGSGAAIYADGTALLRGTIVADSLGSDNCAGSVSDGGYNIDSGNSCGFDPGLGSMINTAPLLGPAGYNGGPTLNLALLAGSPAVNRADPAACPEADQRGLPRRDGVCDIGAYEAQPASLQTLAGSGQTTLVETPFAEPLLAGAADEYGNLLGGVTLVLTSPLSGPSILESGITVTTGLSGTAALTVTANQVPGGPYTVSVSATLYSLTSTAWSLANVAPLTLTLSDAPDPTDVGQPFTVTVAVTGTYGLPTGAVTVSVASETCAITLAGGTGSCVLTLSLSGTYTLTADYAGDDLFIPAQATAQHTVESPPEEVIYQVFLPVAWKESGP